MGRYRTKSQSITEANKRILNEISKEALNTFFPDTTPDNKYEEMRVQGQLESRQGKHRPEIVINDNMSVFISPMDTVRYDVEGCIGKETTISGYKSIYLSSPHIYAEKVECESSQDRDRDGDDIPDRLDLDQDNDGDLDI